MQVGVLSGSLTLTADAMHMLLDCAALTVGLVGEASAHWPPSKAHPYGYARYGTVCALVNALLLLLVGLSVGLEALRRLPRRSAFLVHDDPRLLPVALAGLGLNIIGLVHFHHHAGSGGCADAGCASPGIGGGGGGGGGYAPAAHGGVGDGGGANMRGVFLHVLADTLGSVATIASTLLARHLNWQWADPL